MSRPDALELFEPLDQSVPLQFRQTVDPEDAFKLIDLVLKADGHQALRLFFIFHSIEPFVPHADPLRALDLLRDARHGNASLHVADHLG